MAYAYEAVAVINGRPAGYVGTYVDKEHYRPYPSSPSVRWKRVTVTADEAAAMARGECSLSEIRSTSDRVRDLHEKEPALAPSEIAARLSVSRQLVHAALRRGSAVGRPRKPRSKSELQAEIARLRAQLRTA